MVLQVIVHCQFKAANSKTPVQAYLGGITARPSHNAQPAININSGHQPASTIVNCQLSIVNCPLSIEPLQNWRFARSSITIHSPAAVPHKGLSRPPVLGLGFYGSLRALEFLSGCL